MRLAPEQVSRAVEGRLAQAWLIAGDEPLLAGEAADAVRARARALGHATREIFFVDRSFDWPALQAAAREMSLFSERRVLELRMASVRPGKEGGAVLAELARDPGPDNLLLALAPRLEREAWSSAWFKAFERHGVFVDAKPVPIARLPQWIAARAAALGLSLDEEGAALLAERVEGNLLAARQELELLALLHGATRIGAAEVGHAVARSARYDVFQLGEAALAGEAARALRILDGLRAEGVEPPLVLWSLCRELRALAQARAGRLRRGYGAQAERREELARKAAARLSREPLAPLFAAAARADRQSKGLLGGDAWLTLTGLVAGLAGARLPASPAPRA